MNGKSNYEFIGEITQFNNSEVTLSCKKSFGDNPNKTESVWPRDIFRGELGVGKKVLFQYCCKPKDIYSAWVLENKG